MKSRTLGLFAGGLLASLASSCGFQESSNDAPADSQVNHQERTVELHEDELPTKDVYHFEPCTLGSGEFNVTVNTPSSEDGQLPPYDATADWGQVNSDGKHVVSITFSDNDNGNISSTGELRNQGTEWKTNVFVQDGLCKRHIEYDITFSGGQSNDTLTDRADRNEERIDNLEGVLGAGGSSNDNSNMNNNDNSNGNMNENGNSNNNGNTNNNENDNSNEFDCNYDGCPSSSLGSEMCDANGNITQSQISYTCGTSGDCIQESVSFVTHYKPQDNLGSLVCSGNDVVRPRTTTNCDDGQFTSSTSNDLVESCNYGCFEAECSPRPLTKQELFDLVDVRLTDANLNEVSNVIMGHGGQFALYAEVPSDLMSFLSQEPTLSIRELGIAGPYNPDISTNGNQFGISAEEETERLDYAGTTSFVKYFDVARAPGSPQVVEQIEGRIHFAEDGIDFHDTEHFFSDAD